MVGSGEHVIPTGWIHTVPIKPSEGSRRRAHYVAAKGEKINNQGEQKVPFWIEDGVGTTWRFQVARLNNPLVSAGKLIAEGL